MRLEPTKHLNGRMWQPGQSGNLNGGLVAARYSANRAPCRSRRNGNAIAKPRQAHCTPPEAA
jgi:hypothetical protein